jgi:alkylation response protein AidB-like acyl-CoA dehydrogenase
MDFSWNEEQRMVRAMAREFAEEIREEARVAEEEARFSHEITRKMGEMGFLGMTVPEEYGGFGASYLSYLVALEEITKASPPQGMTMGLHNSLVAYPLLAFGTEMQKVRYLAPIAKGETLGAYALTEPGAGSDVAGQTTRAERVAGGWSITGTKIFITNGAVADVALVWAVTNPGERAHGLSCFIVESATPGFRVGSVETKMGLNSSPTTELVFDGCFVPEENRLGPENDGFRIAMATLDGGRIAVAAQSCALAEAALERAVRYAKERAQFGRPIAQFQGIQWMLADMRVDLDASRLLVYRAAALRERGERHTLESAIAKLHATEMATRVTGKAIQIHGGYGYMREYGVEILYRAAKAAELYEGTSEIQRTIIGRELIR